MISRDDVFEIYRVILNREPESEEAINYHVNAESRRELVMLLISTEEFRRHNPRPPVPGLVTSDEVYAAYRLILDRTPESQRMIDEYTSSAARQDLLRRTLNTEEFLDQRILPLPVGRHLDQDTLPVNIAASPQQLAEMLDGIAKAWRHFGETEPHWSVLTETEYRPDQLNRNLDEFYDSGKVEIARAMAAVKRAGIDPAGFRTAIDFGCGVGRLTLAIADYAGSVTGIDISANHTRVAQAHAEAGGIGNVRYETISAISDLDRYRDVDFVLSLIVLQHNPPPIIANIFRRLLTALKVGGVALIQIPTFIENYKFSTPDYLANGKPEMEMNYLPQHEIFNIVWQAGCIPLEVREDCYTGDRDMLSHMFLLQRLV